MSSHNRTESCQPLAVRVRTIGERTDNVSDISGILASAHPITRRRNRGRQFSTVLVTPFPLFLVANWLSGKHRLIRTRTFWQETSVIARGLILGLLAFMSLLYFLLYFPHFKASVACRICLEFRAAELCVERRSAIDAPTHELRGLNRKYAVVVGWTEAARQFVANLKEQP